jgi:hypothetical protein
MISWHYPFKMLISDANHACLIFSATTQIMKLGAEKYCMFYKFFLTGPTTHQPCLILSYIECLISPTFIDAMAPSWRERPSKRRRRGRRNHQLIQSNMSSTDMRSRAKDSWAGKGWRSMLAAAGQRRSRAGSAELPSAERGWRGFCELLTGTFFGYIPF